MKNDIIFNGEKKYIEVGSDYGILISKEVENNFHRIKVLFNSTKHNTIIIRK